MCHLGVSLLGYIRAVKADVVPTEAHILLTILCVSFTFILQHTLGVIVKQIQHYKPRLITGCEGACLPTTVVIEFRIRDERPWIQYRSTSIDLL